jgi:hypothetical protein
MQPRLDDYIRTREALARLAPLNPGQLSLPGDVLPILRAAGIPSLRIGGALLWRREHVDTLLEDLHRSRHRILCDSDGAR